MFQNLFKTTKPVIGMVHLKALPGSPASELSWEDILKLSLQDADALIENGVDGIQIENQFDKPFLKEEAIGIETTAFLTAVTCAIRQKYPKIPIGVNIHLNGGLQALAVAKAANAQWIRVFNLANGYISNSGYVDALGPRLLRFRRGIAAENIMIFGDFQVKHGSHTITQDRSLEEKAGDIEVSMADAAIITGSETGKAPDKESIQRVKSKINIPLLIGSGINIDNANELWEVADGAIIGSGFKRRGNLNSPIDGKLVREFMEKVR